MSVMTIGALGVVLGAPLPIASGELLLAACVVPSLVMLRVWRANRADGRELNEAIVGVKRTLRAR